MSDVCLMMSRRRLYKFISSTVLSLALKYSKEDPTLVMIPILLIRAFSFHPSRKAGDFREIFFS